MFEFASFSPHGLENSRCTPQPRVEKKGVYSFSSHFFSSKQKQPSRNLKPAVFVLLLRTNCGLVFPDYFLRWERKGGGDGNKKRKCLMKVLCTSNLLWKVGREKGMLLLSFSNREKKQAKFFLKKKSKWKHSFITTAGETIIQTHLEKWQSREGWERRGQMTGR